MAATYQSDNYQIERPVNDHLTTTFRSTNINNTSNSGITINTVLDKITNLLNLLKEVYIRFDTSPQFYLKNDYKVLLDYIAKLTGAAELLNTTTLKINKDAVEDNLITFNSKGEIQDSGKHIGDSTISSNPDSNTVATEKAVKNIVTNTPQIKWVTYGVDKYSECTEAYRNHYIVACYYNSLLYIMATLPIGGSLIFRAFTLAEVVSDSDISVTYNTISLSPDNIWSSNSLDYALGDNSITVGSIEGLEAISNKVQTIDADSTEIQYPSAKAVYAVIEDIDNKKVDKEVGKVLSTNDYTTEEQTKLESIAEGALVNVIETIKLNGADLTVTDKAVNIPLPSTEDFQLKSNLVTTLTYEATDNQYPSAKVVYDIITENLLETTNKLNDLNINKANKATTLIDYGITDAKIVDGTITLGNSTITPISPDALTNYVLKENGKGLYPDTDAIKLAGIAERAQVNVIEGVLIDGTDLIITSRKVNIETTNTTGASVNALATKGYVDSIKKLEIIAVDNLPTASANTVDKIYLIPAVTTTTSNVKDEYITLRTGEEGTYTYFWEKIGSTEVDLSNYVLKEDDKALYPNADATKLTGIEEGAQINKIEKITVNGVELTIANKTVNLNIPSHDTYEVKSNKVTQISDESTDNQYPSAKAVYTVIVDNEFVTSQALNQLNIEKADKATTLAGYGITDTYTKDEIDAKIASIPTDDTFNKMEVLINSSYYKCDIAGTFVGNGWLSDGMTLMKAYSVEGDNYLTAEYQINLENLSNNLQFKLVGCSDLNWYDGVTHTHSPKWDGVLANYTHLDLATKELSFIGRGSGDNILLTDAVSVSEGHYYVIKCKIPNNDWYNAIITVTKETY